MGSLIVNLHFCLSTIFNCPINCKFTLFSYHFVVIIQLVFCLLYKQLLLSLSYNMFAKDINIEGKIIWLLNNKVITQ